MRRVTPVLDRPLLAIEDASRPPAPAVPGAADYSESEEENVAAEGSAPSDNAGDSTDGEDAAWREFDFVSAVAAVEGRDQEPTPDFDCAAEHVMQCDADEEVAEVQNPCDLDPAGAEEGAGSERSIHADSVGNATDVEEDAAGEEGHPEEAIEETPVQRAVRSDVGSTHEPPRMLYPRLQFTDQMGRPVDIRYDPLGDRFVAKCGNPAHGDDCKQQRQAYPGRKRGSGRPVGWLWHWLYYSETRATKADHRRMPIASWEQRRRGRDAVYALPQGEMFSSFEKPERDDLPLNADSEPEHFDL